MRDQLQVESKRFHKNLDKCWHESQYLVDVYNGNAAIGIHGFVEGELWGSIRLCECCGYAEWDYYMVDGIYKSTCLPTCSCKPVNITYDNPVLIRAEMGDKWDGFVEWHDDMQWALLCTSPTHVCLEDEGCFPNECSKCVNDVPEFHDNECQGIHCNADILTDPLLLLQAANSYMEEK